MSQKITITILETSDIHGHILPIQYANHNETETGLAKIATLIRREREAADALLLVDNGDLIQGTPFAYHHAKLGREQPNPMIQCLNELGYDAAVIGNHEFNYGMDHLRKAVRESAFPWLSANTVDEATGEPLFGQPYLLRTLEGGVKVAVLGLTTQYIPNWEKAEHIRGLRFEDAVASAQRWVRHLREAEGADIVIAAYHGGFERDLFSGQPTEPLTGENQGYALCREVEGIDVLLTGHQHRLISGVEVAGVPVVQPGSGGARLGRVRLTLAREEGGRWSIREAQTDLLSPEGLEPDPAILELARPHEELTQQWLDQPIGRLLGDMRVLDPMEVRLKEHPLIEFINRVQMELSGAEISNTALFDNISPGFPEHITMRDIVSNYIYPNTLQVIRVTSRDIKAALEQSAGYFAAYHGEGPIQVSPAFSDPKPQHYNYDMWEGIEYTINISKPVGERIVRLTRQGQPLDPDGEYDVVMNNYRAAGGGNYMMFQGKPVVKDIPTDMAELLAGYIMERGTIQEALNRNWEVVWDGKDQERKEAR
ncbi:bifunctional metallophosphatase/5'-nucleotidase [Paenibacillus mucilaginosus]|uniref:2',3'-cyclic-nucleotide 2'-phosphodiesterase n=1 Tax=Paenibacillus mucilaginosus (strain KNP414) TaxID=1036673 RepID=F8FGL0_PAEMK|nr:bifunctional UDP-sugar hydrolase/5'-nucleotidase [Paenibacillus mucilaginosus]AEI45387.1 2',3'-cyclic-nucleotide 2'-phosphodiesterase [Paenibacillus mucilaginosus KNP414]MCG7217973.1 bifunctional metallophosphatase/5'-nucleotidase [Paenibacillus mucilaginosus]WDM26832.1 bifunctional metallophosphatase/5'-nucleotidase [Paenibacillus mucilaginosus]